MKISYSPAGPSSSAGVCQITEPDDGPSSDDVEALLRVSHDGIHWFNKALQRHSITGKRPNMTWAV